MLIRNLLALSTFWAGLALVSGIEPFSTGVFIGAGLVSSGLYAGWDRVKCQLKECCHRGGHWIPHNVTYLEEMLDQHLFGQHLVKSSVIRALRSHIRRPNPKKALVLSFHGMTGSGKSYVSRFIAESLFKEGMRSKYVHYFTTTLHFPHVKNVDVYKLNLQDWIRGNVSECAESVFIFDEIDKLHDGVIDGIKPFIDYHDNINGVDFRRAIFIFLSNTGGRDITQKSYHFWKEGRSRESLVLADFEDLINEGALNEKGGLYHSSVLEQRLVDHLIPFLPLDQSHVRECIKVSAGERSLTEKDMNAILNQLSYWPKAEKLFSTTGCKRVEAKVQLYLEEMYDDL